MEEYIVRNRDTYEELKSFKTREEATEWCKRKKIDFEKYWIDTVETPYNQ